MPDAAPHPPNRPHSKEEALDQWLVLRAQDSEEDALRRLVARWSARLKRHATRLTGDPHGAADVAQEAWIAIVRGLPRLEDPACFRRWAYRIVTNKSADWVRRRQTHRAHNAPLVEEPTAASVEPTDERLDALGVALAKLPDKDRTILAMHYTESMPLTEIAEALTLPVGTVKSRLYHARQRLKATLEPQSPEDRS
ncbi:ECF RNA polymerase sigma factor SigW [Planctomycetes bacterium MalM25]|nr:ECF RNA polymerase sigma factor SigW [Planctomycetes bacterium MalM25]